MNKIKVAISLINLREKKILILIFLAGLFLSLLEIFSVATIIPIISSIFGNSDNGINNIKIFSLFNSLIQSFNNKNLLIISLYLFTGILVIKNLYAILFIYIKNKFLNAVKFRTSNNLLNKYLDSSYQFLRNNHSSKLIRNIEEVSSFLGYIENLITIMTETLVLLTFLIFLCAINYKIVLYFDRDIVKIYHIS
jgi:ABC-type multidrug transport system fused ATPase/permease subunit